MFAFVLRTCPDPWVDSAMQKSKRDRLKHGIKVVAGVVVLLPVVGTISMLMLMVSPRMGPRYSGDILY